MKAPDKIYVSPNNGVFETQHDNTFVAASYYVNGSIIYFRKGALLEWAKEKYNQASKNADETDERYHYGEVNAFEELIDKLNTL